jgi:hypothetical protein
MNMAKLSLLFCAHLLNQLAIHDFFRPCQACSTKAKYLATQTRFVTIAAPYRL